MLSLLFVASCLLSFVTPLYFYLDGVQKKCFYEELSKDTVLLGKPA
jgi:hypothetical protein